MELCTRYCGTCFDCGRGRGVASIDGSATLPRRQVLPNDRAPRLTGAAPAPGQEQTLHRRGFDDAKGGRGWNDSRKFEVRVGEGDMVLLPRTFPTARKYMHAQVEQ